jgi:hypothetical protein
MDDGDFFILACDDIDDEGRVIPLDTVLSGIDLLMKTDVNKIDIVLSENMYVYREIKIRYMEPIFYTSSLYNK